MNKSSIALMTDSTCDIPEDLIQQYGITVIPELVIWGGSNLSRPHRHHAADFL